MTSTDPNTKSFRLLSPVTILGGLAALALVGWLAFGFFGVQTLFTNEVVDEAGPVFASTADAPADITTTAAAAMSDDGSENAATTAPATDATDTAPTTAPAAATSEIVTLAAGEFIDRDHPTSGVASVLSDGSSQRFLRFEDFVTDNGPDLNVYLSTAEPGASNGDLGADFIDLGDLKGNQGSQNYEIPEGVDLSKYKTVAIWCVRFGVPFGTAPLA